MLINYRISKKMGFLISTTMIYNSLRDSPSRFTKIIISTGLFWTFTKINNMFAFKFGPILDLVDNLVYIINEYNNTMST